MFAQFSAFVKSGPRFGRETAIGLSRAPSSPVQTMFDPATLRTLVIGLAVTAVIGVLSRWLALRGGPRASGERGHIAPNPGLVVTVSLIGLGLAGAAFYATLTQPDSFPAVLVGIGALALTLPTAASLLPDYAIEWTEDGLEGPASNWFPPFGPGRDFIAWADVATVGKDTLGNWFVEDRTGARIRWNFAYGGYGHLMAAVERNCPHLFDPHPGAVA
jgi:hypothetical protein